jgi:beta-lactamase class A
MASADTAKTSGRPPGAKTGLGSIGAISALMILITLIFTGIRLVPGDPASPAGTIQTEAREPDVVATETLKESTPPEQPSGGMTAQMDDAIRRILAENAHFRIGVSLGDVRSGEVRLYGDVSPYLAASTAKVLTAVAYYHFVETGELGLDEPLGNFTAAFHLKAMINSSTNDSWLLLMQVIGFPRLTEYAAAIGINYDPTRNLLTPMEMAILLMKLYSGDLISAEHAAELLGYMQQTNYEELIPPAVPAGVTVYHKYGIVYGSMHDVAILASGDAAYSLVIYTDDPYGRQGRIDVIQQLTREICLSLFK